MDFELLLQKSQENVWPIVLLVSLLVIGLFLTVIRTNPSFGKVKSSQPTVLIVGPANSGKTALYTLLTNGKASETVTSQESNMYKSLPIPFDSDVVATRITIVDLPGHAKLGHILNETLNNYSNIKGILFVIDAAAGNNGVRIAAERLFTLLLRTEQRMGGIDLMIACNKADVFNMIPAVRMKKLLEEEIQNIRETKAKGLGTVGASGSLDDDNEDDGSWLGGDRFDFVNLDSEVSISDGSVLTNNVEHWKRWVEGIVVN